MCLSEFYLLFLGLERKTSSHSHEFCLQPLTNGLANNRECTVGKEMRKRQQAGLGSRAILVNPYYEVFYHLLLLFRFLFCLRQGLSSLSLH